MCIWKGKVIGCEVSRWLLEAFKKLLLKWVVQVVMSEHLLEGPFPTPGGANGLDLREFSSNDFGCSLNSPLQHFKGFGQFQGHTVM